MSFLTTLQEFVESAQDHQASYPNPTDKWSYYYLGKADAYGTIIDAMQSCGSSELLTERDKEELKKHLLLKG